ncbi:hypothetical protein CLV35_1390 [Motilibacter peucedani]|uniref:Uncharacterized protein n=1 Tax=Motilibacter peucedani TaxID=598650 RepID=A0A420XS19_9ACTN|nr:hypothetical protein [Motilibacter peucedani]RKS77696.1 hypothetical protein CLV35_1390 [Motilibacter peucedani]
MQTVHAQLRLERDERSGARRWQAVVAEPSSALDGLCAYGHTFGSARDALLGQLAAVLPGDQMPAGLVLDASVQADGATRLSAATRATSAAS